MKKAVILCLILLVISGVGIGLYLSPLHDYREAQVYLATDEYAAALEILEELGDYRDSEALAGECREALTRAQYLRASALYDAGETEAALSAFLEIAGYRDSADWIARCQKLLEH